MALIARQPQGSCVTFSSRHTPWSKSLKLKQRLTKHHRVGRSDWHYLLKRGILSVGSPCIFGAKIEPFRISAFKGISQNYQKGGRPNGLKLHKAYVRLEEGGEAKSESPKAQNVPLSYASETNNDLANENLPTSTAVHKLFKKWLTALCTQPASEEVKEILVEPSKGALPETLDGSQSTERGEFWKVAWTHFLAVDYTIKIPLLILFVSLGLLGEAKFRLSDLISWERREKGPCDGKEGYCLIKTVNDCFVPCYYSILNTIQKMPSTGEIFKV